MAIKLGSALQSRGQQKCTAHPDRTNSVLVASYASSEVAAYSTARQSCTAGQEYV